MLRAAVLLLLATAAVTSAESVTGDINSLSQPVLLDAKLYREAVVPSKLSWILIFGESDDIDGADELAKELEGAVRVGIVNHARHKDLLAAVGVEEGASIPVARAFPYGENAEGSDYATVEEAKQAALDSLPMLVKELNPTQGDIQEFLVVALRQFRMPVLVFTDKEGVPSLLQKAALWFDDSYMIAVLANAPGELQHSMGVQKLPQLQIMIPQPTEDGHVQFGAFLYDRKQFGGLKMKNLLRFLAAARMDLERQNLWPKRPESETPPPAASSNIKPKPIFQVTHNTPDACADTKLGLCIVALLDGSPLNDEQRAEQLRILEEVQQSPVHKGRALHYMWVDATCHPAFAEAFEIRDVVPPMVFAYTPSKKRYALNLGGFSKDQISKFITGVLGGAVRVTPLPAGTDSFPAIPADVDCAALHSADMPVEEDFDLDDIMQEVLAEGETRGAAAAAAEAEADKAAVNKDEEDELEAKRRRAMEEVERLNQASRRRRRRRRNRRRASKPKDEL